MSVLTAVNSHDLRSTLQKMIQDNIPGQEIAFWVIIAPPRTKWWHYLVRSEVSVGNTRINDPHYLDDPNPNSICEFTIRLNDTTPAHATLFFGPEPIKPKWLLEEANDGKLTLQVAMGPN